MRSTKRALLRSIGASPLVLALATRPTQANVPTETGESDDLSGQIRLEATVALADYIRSVPVDEEDRSKAIEEYAVSVSELTESILPGTDFDEFGDDAIVGDSTIGVIKNVVQNLNQTFGTDYSTKNLDQVSRIFKYVPLLSSLQNHLEVCRKIAEATDHADREEQTESFYISLLLVVVELILLPSSVGYRSAFMGTRYFANYGLVRVRHIVGLRAYSMLLSGVHWSLRGTIEGTIAYIVRKTAETIDDKELRALTIDKLTGEDLNFKFLEDDSQYSDSATSMFDGWLDSQSTKKAKSDWRDKLPTKRVEDSSESWWPFA